MVLAILVVVTAITIPSLRGGSGAEVRAAVQAVAAGLRYVRSEAVTRNRSLTFIVDVDKKQYAMDGDDRVRPLPASVDVALYTAQSELRDDQSGAIRFFSDGSSTGGRITISARQRSYLIDVDWLTGMVRVLDVASDDVVNETGRVEQ